ncbi:MAG: 4a-hydroxytetrahydrobiopterin dehydratase [Flavobacteriaceae bacterium]|jgi:4a-hydroxytetrahydrobiopterin dehydratase|nr:4a-hydroxytetrahydrobiopterin dehydratase [Flavobacteriaceae bacterium]MDG1968351.1 4a-hydroxytetrahydrobiopterin dehydratase [Flavobacteriaceae bacterium]
MKMESKWDTIDGKLIKSFAFKDFNAALKFINQVGAAAEAINHHPKITNVYNKVNFELWTHDQNSITGLDHQLSHEIDQIFENF